MLCSYSYSNAQVNPTTGTGQTGDSIVLGGGWQGTLSQCRHNVNCWAGQTDNGDIHYSPNTGNGTTYYWSGTQQTLSNTIAINQALQAQGIQVDGFDYQWVYKNGNANWFSGQPGGGAVDPFEIVVNVYDSNGNLFKSYKYDYGQNFSNWNYNAKGTETFNQNYLTPSYFGNVEVLVTGQDIAGQSGYWGPEFRADESGLYVNYSLNPCYNNALHDPACPGYANALFQQQCTQNPLFDPSCPGYANANQTLICTQNPTSDPSCPDYYIANCKADPLWDPGCQGYATAYFEQHCSLDPQYSDQCMGYIDYSGNDGDYIVLDPFIDDILTVEDDSDPYESDVPIFEFSYVEDPVQEDPTVLEFDESVQKLEDDIEKEIAQLEQEGGDYEDGELNLEDDIEKEITQLEQEGKQNTEDPSILKGKGAMEDDIEKEIAELEKESNSEQGESKPVEEEDVQVSNNSDRPNRVEPSSNKRDKRKSVPNKSTSRRDKMRMLIAQKAVEATKELEEAVTLEQTLDVQRRILALISYVPDFKNDYTNAKLPTVNFYPPKPVVDHQYARWFLNDPTFGAMEDIQYPSLR